MNTNKSESLFHYTQTLNKLQSILEDGLIFFYCMEIFDCLKVWIPMVCFCDIPLHSAEKHRERYGNYVLSLSKKTLLSSDFKNYINPVFYHQSEGVTKSILHINKIKKQTSEEFDKFKNEAIKIPYNDKEVLGWSDPPKKLFSNFLDLNKITFTEKYLLGFSKKYCDKDNEENITINYDEKEWRIVLPDQPGSKWIWDDAEYQNIKTENSEGKKYTSNNYKLSFCMEDITKIIVPLKKDEEELIKYIHSPLFKLCNQTINTELLEEKVISFERMEKD